MDLKDIIAQLGILTPDSILVTDAEQHDGDGPRIVWCNSAFTRLTGYTLEEVRGQSPRILQGPDTDPETCATIRRKLADWERFSAEIKNYTRDGEPFWVEITLTPVANGSGCHTHWIGYQREITARKEQEFALRTRVDTLRAQEELVRFEREEVIGIAAVAEHAQELITITDPDFRILWANPAFCRRTGYRKEAIIGRSHCELIGKSSERFSSRAAAQQAILKGAVSDIACRNTDIEGTPYWTDLRLSVLRDGAGRPTRLVMVEREVTERLEQQRALEEALDEARAAARAKSQFLANMSHEIRTPMNGIIGMAELLCETPLGEDQAQCAETIRESAQALLTLINDILDISKVESGKIVLEPEPVCVSRMLDDVAHLLSGPAGEKCLEILIDDRLVQAEGAAHLRPGWFMADPARLRQILVNLVGNAVKFTFEGRILISAWIEPPDRGWGRNYVAISVEDTGIGIPDDKIGTIFNAFEQADASVSRRFEGSGLGLAISRSLAQAMNGTITASSREGEGSVFTLRLPLPPAQPQGDGPPERPALTGREAVLVAADPEARRVIGNMIESLGIGLRRFGALCDLPCGDALAQDTVIVVNLETGCSLQRTLARLAEMGPDLGRARGVVLLSPRDWQAPGAETTPTGTALPTAVLKKPVRRGMLADTIHRVLVPEAGPVARRALATDATPPDLAGLRILVAEDNRTNRLVVERMLRPIGATLDFAEDGQQAVDMYAAGEYGIVLMDISMPVMDGRTASRRIRELEAERQPPRTCPIIALTAHAMPEDHARCVEAGIDLVLTKPIRKRELYACLRDALRTTRNAAA